jgi:hypothetical protein
MLAVVRATGAARVSAQTTLASGFAKLDAERAAIDAIWTAAKRATGGTSAFPSLPA